MAIIYYPDEVFKQRRHVVEQLQQPNMLYGTFGTQNLGSGALAAGIWSSKGWEVRRISLNFTSASNKTYTLSVVHGIGIAAGLNDRLWVKVPGLSTQEIIIPQGFYTGATMATALAAALNASGLPAASKAFTASYDSSAGTFTIAPNAGTMRIYKTNPGVNVRSNSTLAPLIGFTANTADGASAVSDAAVLGLGTAMTYLSAVNSTSVDVLSTDAVAMTMDNQLLISASSSSSMTASYEVVYKMLDA